MLTNQRNILLLIVCFLPAGNMLLAQTPHPQDVLITIRKENTPVGEVLKEIEAQSGYYFVFSKEDLNPNQRISLQVKNAKLETVLQQCLPPLRVAYIFSGNHIILKQQNLIQKPDSKNGGDANVSIMKKIQGVVTNSNGEPVVGAVVYEKDLETNASLTDAEGKFTLTLPASGWIVIHSLGYTDKTIATQGNSFLSIALEENVRKIGEIIVVGYGVQQRLNVTGAIATVTGEQLTQMRRPDLSNTLASNLLGVRAIQRSGRPGYDGSQIDIRGYGDEILTIVDGVERTFSQIDPNEIESLSILKDAAAAVYGTRGANGVLLITTKKGYEARPKISYNFNYAAQSITRYPKYMNVWDYMTCYNEARQNLAHLGQTPLFSAEEIANAKNTDWQGAVLNNFAPMQQHNVNVTGGTKDAKYFLSLGYLNQDGILKTKDNFCRFNFRSNVSAVIAGNLAAEMQLGGRKEVRDAPATISGGGVEDNFSQGIFMNIAMALPYKPIYANNNPAYYNDLGSELNPVALLDRNLVGTDLKQYEEFNGQFSLHYQVPFVNGFSLKALAAYDRQTQAQQVFKKACAEYIYYPIEEQYIAMPLTQTTGKSETLRQNEILTQQYSIHYNNTMDRQDISALLLWETRRFFHKENSVSGEFEIASVPELDAAGVKNKVITGNSYRTAGMGIIGRINYLLDDKYLLELSFREDGVSKFLKHDRWVFTAGISAGWRISEENFIRNHTTVLDNLKLRASYGIFPLAPNLNEYYYLAGYNYPGRNDFGGPVNFVQGENNIVLAATERGIINPYLTWEKAAITDVGLDVSLWRKKLYAELDGFYRMHTGIYATRSQTLPTSFGAGLPDENLNSESNRGIELMIGTMQKQDDWYFDLKGTFTYSRKKREYQELPVAGNQYAYWGYRYQEDNGHISKNPYRWDNISWGYEALGQFRDFEEILQSPIQDEQGNTTLLPGDIKYKDVNNDGLINELDIIPIGRSDRPEIFFGFNLLAKWKNVDFTLFFQGATNYTYTFNYKESFILSGVGNGYEMHKDRWRRADANDPYSEWIPGRFPALRVEGYSGNLVPSTFWNINTAYLRLKTIDLGYTLPRTITRKAGIEKFRIYVSGYNLFIFSKKDLKQVDPESESGYGLYYPQMKTVNFGINIEF
jgi:TonB-linked SusC/RagA family outer membrane protein